MRINITLSGEQKGNYVTWSVEITGNVLKATMERIVELAKKADTLLPSDILDRNDYIATTLWTVAHIKQCLDEEGFEPSDENVDAIISTGMLKNLGGYKDSDWESIYDAIRWADECGSLKWYGKDEDKSDEN